MGEKENQDSLPAAGYRRIYIQMFKDLSVARLVLLLALTFCVCSFARG
ncbi:MAG: hypothetical protein QOH42_1710, partial [Blastocatellia bacterium]|nr:hypothetical protein [Blastocatellia bacterium]